MTCSDDAWHGLWTDFNRLTTDTIRVNREHLRDVLCCHDECLQERPNERRDDGLLAAVPREGSNTIVVNRITLFNLLRYHGSVCGRGAGFAGDRGEGPVT